jgi:hypothetical protein
MVRKSGLDYRLRPQERETILLSWLRSSIGRSQALEREFANRSTRERS